MRIHKNVMRIKTTFWLFTKEKADCKGYTKIKALDGDKTDIPELDF